MEPTDLTIKILQEIRDEQRATRTELRAEISGLREELKAEVRELREESREAQAQANARFEVIETSLRDVAQQLVLLARGIKTALEHRPEVDRRIEALERRVEALEKPQQ